MKLKKGDRIHFISRDEIEVVEKGSSNSVSGMIKTNREEYSMDFISRWKQFGFLTILPKNEKGSK